MTKQKLYIIGNGFDLYHNFKTSYGHFCNYVKNNHEDLFIFLEKYIYFEHDKNGLWSNFESSLSTFDFDTFMGDHDYTDPTQDKFKPSDVFGLEDELIEISEIIIEKIRQTFYDWLMNIEQTNEKFKLLPLDKNATYISFNYTPTLENLYNIQDLHVLHIHNSIMADYTNLIFGHGKYLEDEPLLDSEGNSTRHLYTDSQNASKMILAQYYKDTKSIMKKHDYFFNNLSHIIEIIILGHSINEIDMPYFKYLHKVLPNVSWLISYYGDNEKQKIQVNLTKADINASVRFFTLREMQFS